MTLPKTKHVQPVPKTKHEKTNEKFINLRAGQNCELFGFT
jgi:hypothetical protein